MRVVLRRPEECLEELWEAGSDNNSSVYSAKSFSRNKQKHIVKEMRLKKSFPMGGRGILSREKNLCCEDVTFWTR